MKKDEIGFIIGNELLNSNLNVYINEKEYYIRFMDNKTKQEIILDKSYLTELVKLLIDYL